MYLIGQKLNAAFGIVWFLARVHYNTDSTGFEHMFLNLFPEYEAFRFSRHFSNKKGLPLLQAGGSPFHGFILQVFLQTISLVNSLPGKGYVVASKVTVSCGCTVDRSAQV